MKKWAAALGALVIPSVVGAFALQYLVGTTGFWGMVVTAGYTVGAIAGLASATLLLLSWNN